MHSQAWLSWNCHQFAHYTLKLIEDQVICECEDVWFNQLFKLYVIHPSEVLFWGSANHFWMLWAWRICAFAFIGMSLARSKVVELGFEKKEGPQSSGRKGVPFSSELSFEMMHLCTKGLVSVLWGQLCPGHKGKLHILRVVAIEVEVTVVTVAQVVTVEVTVEVEVIVCQHTNPVQFECTGDFWEQTHTPTRNSVNVWSIVMSNNTHNCLLDHSHSPSNQQQ